jgi:hypothetical protein
MNEPQDNTNHGGTTHQNAIDPNTVVAKIEITLKANGRVDVTGMIADRVVAYGLIETAKEVVSNYHRQRALDAVMAKKEQPRIIIPGLHQNKR